eukprot:Nk52_evm55s621 gene=Nk52_evmTU55s621
MNEGELIAGQETDMQLESGSGGDRTEGNSAESHQAKLRREILRINNDATLGEREKSLRVQEIMTRDWNSLRRLKLALGGSEAKRGVEEGEGGGDARGRARRQRPLEPLDGACARRVKERMNENEDGGHESGSFEVGGVYGDGYCRGEVEGERVRSGKSARASACNGGCSSSGHAEHAKLGVEELEEGAEMIWEEEGDLIYSLNIMGKEVSVKVKGGRVREQIEYFDKRRGILGCRHYQRSCKMVANCCGEIFTCRLCHDEAMDHPIDRYATKEMICMCCGTRQECGIYCQNETCPLNDGTIVPCAPIEKDDEDVENEEQEPSSTAKADDLCDSGKPSDTYGLWEKETTRGDTSCAPSCTPLAKYYCDKCKLWDDDHSKDIYHCDKCNLCRIGEGLDIDYFHCEGCNVCMAVSLKGNHKCIERNLESNCPICDEFMFTSTKTVIFMPCGHCIHHACYEKYIMRSYQCPICSKSLGDMRDYFSKIDCLLKDHKMPKEFENVGSLILCNDCEKKSEAPYHFLYHKCAHCSSYNTRLLEMIFNSEEQQSSTTGEVDEAT